VYACILPKKNSQNSRKYERQGTEDGRLRNRGTKGQDQWIRGTEKGTVGQLIRDWGTEKGRWESRDRSGKTVYKGRETMNRDVRLGQRMRGKKRNREVRQATEDRGRETRQSYLRHGI
jgi:hypothetical protein